MLPANVSPPSSAPSTPTKAADHWMWGKVAWWPNKVGKRHVTRVVRYDQLEFLKFTGTKIMVLPVSRCTVKIENLT